MQNVFENISNALRFEIMFNVRRVRTLICLFMVPLFLSATGCGTLSNGRGWGQDAIWPVDVDRIACAARDALLDWQTFIPAAGALVFAVDDWDHKASDWAIQHNPIFGSVEDAKDASGYLKTALQIETVITTFATPSGDDPRQWAYAKLRGIGVEMAAYGLANFTTSALKSATGRTRPDDSSDKSFPSGHATRAFSYATMCNRNLDTINIPKGVKRTFQISNLVLATGVAWARVEGARHYPSDVLVGAALSHFLTRFIYDAFLPLPEDDRFDFMIFPKKGGGSVQLTFRF